MTRLPLVGLLALLALSACAEGRPAVELDVSSVPVGATISVAPCHPDEPPSMCQDHTQPVLEKTQSSITAGVFGIPAGVTQFVLEVTNTPPTGDGSCVQLEIVLMRNDQKIQIVGGTTLSIACQEPGDCGPQSACPGST